jgi:hypothetical protein
MTTTSGRRDRRYSRETIHSPAVLGGSSCRAIASASSVTPRYPRFRRVRCVLAISLILKDLLNNDGRGAKLGLSRRPIPAS